MSKQWFIYDGTQQKGPFTEDAITEMLRKGILNDRTALWTEGMANWIPLRDTPFSAVGFEQHQQPGRTEAPSNPIHSATIANHDQPLFEYGDVIVTSSILVHENNHYQLSAIKSVVFFKEPLDVKGLLINAVVALVGLFGIFTCFPVGLIIGLIAIGLGGFNLYGIYNEYTNPTYIVAIGFHTEESIYIKMRDMAQAMKLRDTLLAVMRS